MLHAGAAVRRGRLWQGLWYLTRVRNRALALAQQRHGYDADSFDNVDDLPDEEVAAFHPTLVASLEPAALLEALEAAMRCLVTELRRGDPELADPSSSPCWSSSRWSGTSIVTPAFDDHLTCALGLPR